MNDLNKDVLILLALDMDLSDVINFCKTSKRINEKICQSNDFWRQKLINDFKIESVDPKKSYIDIINNKIFCKRLHTVYKPNEVIMSDLRYNTKFKSEDTQVFDYLYMKLLGKGFPRYFEITYRDNIEKTKYANRISITNEFTEDEFLVLTEILQNFMNILKKRKGPLDRFYASFINTFLRNEIPFDVTLKDLCNYNIY